MMGEAFIPPTAILEPPDNPQCVQCEQGAHAGCRIKGCGCACQEPAWSPKDLRSVSCPTCKVPAGALCTNAQGDAIRDIHFRRRLAATGGR